MKELRVRCIENEVVYTNEINEYDIPNIIVKDSTGPLCLFGIITYSGISNRYYQITWKNGSYSAAYLSIAELILSRESYKYYIID